MPYDRTIAISSFKFGLDTRREELVALPGTLLTIENAHINQGGEAEKRGKFSVGTSVSPLDSNGDQGTFGLEVTDVGPMVFGSALNFGSSVTISQPTLASAVTGATYQQLMHPELVMALANFGTGTTIAYNRLYHRMTSVVFSENFNGKSVVIAQFADTRGGPTRFLYYNGSLVYQSSNGWVFDNYGGPDRFSGEFQAFDLIRQFNTLSGWKAASTGVSTAPYYLGALTVKSPAGDYFTPIFDTTSAVSGFAGSQVTDLDQPAVIGTRAIAGFKIVQASPGTVIVQAPQNGDGTQTIYLTDIGVNSAGTAALTAIAVAASINLRTFAHGYSAVANADDVYVFAPLNFGNVTFNITVTVSGGITTSAATTAAIIPLVVTIDGSDASGQFNQVIISVEKRVPKRTVAPATLITSPTAHATSQAGGASYTWTQISGATGILLDDANKATCKLSATLAVNTDLIATFKCAVVDAVGATGSAYATVFFNYFIEPNA